MLPPKLVVFNFLDDKDYRTIEIYILSHNGDKGSFVFKENGRGGYIFFIA